MSALHDETQSRIQAKLFDFALSELVYQHRDSFQPLWTIESWAKFLIWMGLNCGLSGDKQTLEVFAGALGNSLTSRMRRLFFERTLEDLELKVMADPAELNVLIMPCLGDRKITFDHAHKALESVGLKDRVVLETNLWKNLDAVIAIPWQVSETDN